MRKMRCWICLDEYWRLKARAPGGGTYAARRPPRPPRPQPQSGSGGGDKPYKMYRYAVIVVLAFPLVVFTAARRPPDPDFEFADAEQAVQPAVNDDGADFLQSPRLAYETDSSPCRAVVCRRREVCTVRAGVAVCTPRAHHAHRNSHTRTTIRKASVGGDELAESTDDDVLYETAHNDLEPEREQRTRCVGCGSSSASGGERGFLCGSDNRTYSSLCRLDLHNCVRRPAPPVRLACRGFCPCRHDRRRTRPDREKILRRRYEQSNEILSPARPQSTGTGRTGSVGPECSLDQMADRLLDWFSVLMQQSGAPPPPPSPPVDDEGLSGVEARAWRSCKPEVRWMFARLDADGDGRLSSQDLYALRHDDRERCLRPFLATCAGGGGGNVSRGAWCSCLRRAARPCTALQTSIPARPGAYVPACDAAGFYRPLQCHAALGVCWCVDAHGVERAGSRTKGRPRCPPASPRPLLVAPSLRPPSDDEDALGLGSGDADLRF